MRTFWVFDYDGTLSSIVEDRSKAKIHQSCRDLLHELTLDTSNVVAILSSRSLEDLISRVTVNNIIIGGGSGAEWRMQDGSWMTLSGRPKNQLIQTRQRLMKQIEKIAGGIEGIELEDKRWSVAIHTRKAQSAAKKKLQLRLKEWNPSQKVNILSGPEVSEIQLLPELHKRTGLRMLMRLLEFNAERDKLVYAGDDENDALAMSLVKELGGDTITVGPVALVKGGATVYDPAGLANEIRKRLTGSPKVDIFGQAGLAPLDFAVSFTPESGGGVPCQPSVLV